MDAIFGWVLFRTTTNPARLRVAAILSMWAMAERRRPDGQGMLRNATQPIEVWKTRFARLALADGLRYRLAAAAGVAAHQPPCPPRTTLITCLTPTAAAALVPRTSRPLIAVPAFRSVHVPRNARPPDKDLEELPAAWPCPWCEGTSGAEGGAFGRMSDGKGDEKVSSSRSCPLSTEDLIAPFERAKRMKGLESEESVRKHCSQICKPLSLTGLQFLAEMLERAKRIMGEGLESKASSMVARRIKATMEAFEAGGSESKTELQYLAERKSILVKFLKKYESGNLQKSMISLAKFLKEMEPVELSHLKNKLELVELSHLDNKYFMGRGAMAVSEDEKLKEPPKLEATIKMEGEDEDHHGASPKLEAPMTMEGKEHVVVLGDEVWESEEPKPKSPPRRMEMMEVGKVDMLGSEEPELEEMEDTPHWMTVSQYRIHWGERWSGHFGSFEDTTRIPPMRFTEKAKAVHDFGIQRDTLQVFSVKLAATRGSLQLPLDVFGMVAVRDPIDHNRNIIFQRKRDECQTLTEKDPYLVLAGPTRAVMFSDAKSNPVVIEVDLKVKGATESEDRCLSFLVYPLTCSGILPPRVFKFGYTSKLSRLEFTLGHIFSSVEATIFVRVIHGSWPDGVRGLFTTATTGYSDRSTAGYSAGVAYESIILLDSGAERSPVADDGQIKLARHVISAEDGGEMIFQVKAFEGDNNIVEKKISFDPLQANKSISVLDVGFCKMEITVCWSLVSY